VDSSWLDFVGTCEFGNYPFVDNIATWYESLFNMWHADSLWDMKIDSGLTIWVVGAFADSLIFEVYEVHCCQSWYWIDR
jgi:hypothetical protein